MVFKVKIKLSWPGLTNQFVKKETERERKREETIESLTIHELIVNLQLLSFLYYILPSLFFFLSNLREDDIGVCTSWSILLRLSMLRKRRT